MALVNQVINHYASALTPESLFTLIEVTGPDAQRFLQAQTTSDVRSLKAGQGQPSSLLDRKAKIQSYFYLYFAAPEHYLIVTINSQAEGILEHLQKFTFADRVDYSICPDKSLIVSGTKAFIQLKPLLFEGISTACNGATQGCDMLKSGDGAVRLFRLDLAPCSTCVVFYDNKSASLIDKLKPHFDALSQQELTVRRVEAGIALPGVDYTDLGIVELSLSDPAISYTKGCFQGQEVLARVKLQGTPARQLTGLTISQINGTLAVNSPILVDGEEIGTFASNAYSQRLGQNIALAFIKRDFRTPERVYQAHCDDQDFEATVTVLPFIPIMSDEQLATLLYDEALQDFAREQNELAIQKLKEAIVLRPTFEDAYESLGVIISKTEGHSTHEAIEIMNELVKLNKDSVMAHTNLSVFYVELGDKEKAEEEKAISMSIRMQLAAKQAMQEMKSKEDQAAKIKETEERMKMFAEVIKIDADDLFANQGLGNCHNILGNYKEALLYLNKAITIKSNHTQTYEELATAYLGLNDQDGARAALEKGIEVAAVKGDMTPLKAMQEKLATLKAKAGSTSNC
ncbi:MAG: hypothetical protein IPJ49_01720 [Candidatus Obscuribacter sp.]|nr:hypothetical protein [Candidatus Obscuribacter sp.]